MSMVNSRGHGEGHLLCKHFHGQASRPMPGCSMVMWNDLMVLVVATNSSLMGHVINDCKTESGSCSLRQAVLVELKALYYGFTSHQHQWSYRTGTLEVSSKTTEKPIFKLTTPSFTSKEEVSFFADEVSVNMRKTLETFHSLFIVIFQ